MKLPKYKRSQAANSHKIPEQTDEWVVPSKICPYHFQGSKKLLTPYRRTFMNSP